MWSSKRLVLAGLFVVSLAACGFQLRGSYELPYKSAFVAAPSTSQVAVSLRRELGNSNVVISPLKDAEVQVNVLEERRDKQILSLSGAGRVREYTLRLVVRYQLMDRKGSVIIPTSEIQLTRILGYDDTKIIAKQQEETMLYSDMEHDVVGQIIRRMIAVKRAV